MGVGNMRPVHLHLVHVDQWAICGARRY